MQHATPYCVAMTLPAALLIFCHSGECAAQAHGAYSSGERNAEQQQGYSKACQLGGER